MSRIYNTTSLESKAKVELYERTENPGLRYVIKRNGLLVAECDAICDAYREYNYFAAK